MSKKRFRKWLEEVIAVKDWNDVTANDLINDPTYDYEVFYNKQPDLAAGILKDDPRAHFSDIGKTVFHPTFSDESYYSGRRSLRNPRGIIGGHWGENSNGNSTYTLSPSQVKNNWDLLNTINYLSDAEDNGAVIYTPNKTLPVINGVRFDGVLPNVEVTAKRKKK